MRALQHRVTSSLVKKILQQGQRGRPLNDYLVAIFSSHISTYLGMYMGGGDTNIGSPEQA